MPSRILLLSCYELGHQPLGLAWPLAFLREAGLEAEAADLAVEPFPEEKATAAALVAISAPMHTALRLGVRAAERTRRSNPRAHVAFFGLYAGLNAEALLRGVADSVLAGENEQSLARLAGAILAGEDPAGIAGVRTRGSFAGPALERPRFPVPERGPLPALDRYARFVEDGRASLSGYAEASRGCKHLCRHCPVVPVYGGRFFAVPVETVMADVGQQVAAGARHVSFGDPDFLNGKTHALRVARALHARHPGVGFDFTTKVEHVLKHRALLPELRALGCRFVVSAVESLSEVVLARLRKGHTARDVLEAMAVLDQAGIALHPTLVPFTPWASLDDYLELIELFRGRGLAAHVPPVQLSIRLLVPPGSALLGEDETRTWLGELDPEGFLHRWRHPDPRMDELHAAVAALVEDAEGRREPGPTTWERIRALAYGAAGRSCPEEPVPPAFSPEPPRLTEHWFC